MYREPKPAQFHDPWYVYFFGMRGLLRLMVFFFLLLVAIFFFGSGGRFSHFFDFRIREDWDFLLDVKLAIFFLTLTSATLIWLAIHRRTGMESLFTWKLPPDERKNYDWWGRHRAHRNTDEQA
ncbi:MAG TPA: hypothetical protein VK525_09020 [Candidatus Saccharimonadales bacterium]|nr:hypothetical protein [Candidatus Saccharimonadales bacterium]